MSTPSHSPAPWEISKHATPEYAPQFGIYSSGNRNDLALVEGDNAKADAQLIAAAPELLDALKNATNVLAAIAIGDLKKINRDSPGLAQARAAIRKATEE